MSDAEGEPDKQTRVLCKITNWLADMGREVVEACDS